MLGRHDAALAGHVGQDIDGIGDDDDGRAIVELHALEVVENRLEERDVAVDELEAGLVGLAAETGGYDHTVAAVDHAVIAAAGEPLVRRERCAVAQVQSLARGHFRVHVDERHLADHAAELKRVRRVGSDAATTANDADLHCPIMAASGG